MSFEDKPVGESWATHAHSQAALQLSRECGENQPDRKQRRVEELSCGGRGGFSCSVTFHPL